MAHRLLLATKNPGKLREFRELLGDLPALVLVAPDQLGKLPDVNEDGESFEHNAKKKARELAAASGLMVLADDSGLEVDALAGRPGVHSARYAGATCSDEDNNEKLARELDGVPRAQRTARYRVVLALADPEGPLADRIHTEEGACEGLIRDRPAGSGGFGYDPYFEPEGHDQTMAELSPDQKNRISHRGRAARKIRAFLTEYLATRSRGEL
jgi:XTP/dITP diphosphohydrolase